MRRILRKIAEGEPDKVGDTSTLADPSVVTHLVEESKDRRRQGVSDSMTNAKQ